MSENSRWGMTKERKEMERPLDLTGIRLAEMHPTGMYGYIRVGGLYLTMSAAGALRDWLVRAVPPLPAEDGDTLDESGEE